MFLDGRPGHEKQSRGILAALKRVRAVEVTEIQVQPPSPGRYVLDLWRLFFLGDGGCRYDLPPADLLLGTGSRTHLALLACKKKYGIPAVTCMAPDVLLRNRFDLCFVPQHDGIPAGANIFLTIGPPNLSTAHWDKDMLHGLILIGGVDTGSHFWDSDRIQSYIERIVQKEPNIHWTISSSPRTPAETIDQLEAYASCSPNCSFFDFHNTPAGWVEKQYAKSGVVWVTADSMSMVYEALSAGCRVGVLPVRWKTDKNKFQRSCSYLLENKLVISFSMWDEENTRWRDEVVPLNEAERCAAEIVRRWF